MFYNQLKPDTSSITVTHTLAAASAVASRPGQAAQSQDLGVRKGESDNVPSASNSANKRRLRDDTCVGLVEPFDRIS